MKKEEAKKIIEKTLKKMNCEGVTFFESKEENYIEVVFNCKEITSFVTEIPGWSYSGIQLDSTGGHQYKIEFKKVT